MTTTGRSLGTEIRAARLGFGWLADVERYVRVTAIADRFRIEAVTPDAVPKRTTPDEHYIWWATNDPDLRPVLARTVSRLTKQGTGPWLVDGLGRLVKTQ